MDQTADLGWKVAVCERPINLFIIDKRLSMVDKSTQTHTLLGTLIF